MDECAKFCEARYKFGYNVCSATTLLNFEKQFVSVNWLSIRAQFDSKTTNIKQPKKEEEEAEAKVKR